MPRARLHLESLEDRTVPSASQYVTSLYASFLNRAPSQDELASYVNLLNG